MGILRDALLWGSKNTWLAHRVPKYSFVKRSVKRFMPGEEISDAVDAAKKLQTNSISTVFTHLGENISGLAEAAKVVEHYKRVLKEISENGLDTEISIKLTQIGLDHSVDSAYINFREIASEAERFNNFVWIDMEGSAYTDMTIAFYKKAVSEFKNVGLCLQAYLFRTNDDLKDLVKISSSIRLVKGAYKEPREIALQDKYRVDDYFLDLSQKLLKESQTNNIRAAFATHDEKLVQKIISSAEKIGMPKEKLEFQMLYGIKTSEQKRIVKEGYRMKVLISYGHAWFSWYMRRLAERPANVWFVLKNIFIN